MQRQIVITYDTDTVGLEDGDLFGYLRNELDNAGIGTLMAEIPDNDTLFYMRRRPDRGEPEPCLGAHQGREGADPCGPLRRAREADMNLTERQLDAPRYFLLGLEGEIHDFEQMRDHMRRLGSSIDSWPEELKTARGHITKSAKAAIIYSMMRAAAAEPIPGPWEIVMPGEGINDSENIEIHDPFGRMATVYGEVNDPETLATARQIATAGIPRVWPEESKPDTDTMGGVLIRDNPGDEEGSDYTLSEHARSVWITTGGFQVYLIRRGDDSVKVEVSRLGGCGDPIAMFEVGP